VAVDPVVVDLGGVARQVATHQEGGRWRRTTTSARKGGRGTPGSMASGRRSIGSYGLDRERKR
jgi:hypothetical protein